MDVKMTARRLADVVARAIEQGDAEQALEAVASHIGYVRQNFSHILRGDARRKS